MIFGFEFKSPDGGTERGVVSASSETDARDLVCETFGLTYPDVAIQDPADLLDNQYAGLALLTTGSL